MTVISSEYGVLGLPSGNVVVVIVGTSKITSVNDFESEPIALVAVIVKVYVPAVVGVPEIVPLEWDSPGGSVVVDHVIVGVPSALKVTEYGILLVIVPRLASVVMTGAPAAPIVIVYCFSSA